MSIKFISSKDSNETCIMHAKSDNVEIMTGSETNDIIEELRDSLLQSYHKGLEESMRGSEFLRDSVDLLYYHLHRISLKRGESYVDSPKWLKDKGATINPKNKKDNKCFKYAITVALNHQSIGNNPQRISNASVNGKILIFRQPQKTRKRLNKKIMLLISYSYHTTQNK